MPKCRHCKVKLQEGEGVRVQLSWYCNRDHAIAYGTGKTRSNFEKKCRGDRKEAKQNDLGWQHEVTQKAFNKMRVLEELLWFSELGVEPYCISCLGTIGNDIWCCGHNKSRGANGWLRYDRRNTFLQHNKRCNSALSGNIYGAMNTVGYEGGLRHRFGEIKGQEIIDYCDTSPKVGEWACDQLELMRKDFNAKTRKLQKLLGN